jgi:hypothetical protein
LKLIHIAKLLENAEIVSINPLVPQSWGDFLKLGDTPRPPAGIIMHLFFSGLFKYPNIQDYS